MGDFLDGIFDPDRGGRNTDRASTARAVAADWMEYREIPEDVPLICDAPDSLGDWDDEEY
ncbi:MAG TPA: hypothetical protein DD735_09320 [Clostridiales bacterium]|jgi:hypothetical protein|nr:hypothetical protein [Clostridiales bacterium]